MTPSAARLLALALVVATPTIALAQPAPAGVMTTRGLADTVNGGHVLGRGDSGVAVRELQTRLGGHGHAVAVDGDFGPATEAAVKAFQQAQALVADGLVGPSTLRRLEQTPGTTPAPAPASGGGFVGALGGTPSGPPSSSTPVSQVHARALPWAQLAQAAGRHTLVIVFEGLWAYSSSYAERIYEYQDALRAGQSPSRPAASGLSFVSSLLIVPNLPESQRTADLLILPETSENGDTSIAEQAARAWHRVHGADLKLIVIGHSFGGWSAMRLGNKLVRHGVPITSMLTVDARSVPTNYRYFITPSNVGVHANYYQKGLWMPGYAVDGAQNQRLHVGHGGIPGAPEVVARYRAMLR